VRGNSKRQNIKKSLYEKSIISFSNNDAIPSLCTGLEIKDFDNYRRQKHHRRRVRGSL
jgi:hypothetical protein